ncbi:MAG: hypothetical protein ACJ8C8_22410 [Microvirga sp.]
MRRRKPQPGGVDPFRAALALEELDLPREAAERMREPKRRIVGAKRPRGLAIVHPARSGCDGAVSRSMVNDRLTTAARA